MDAETDTAANNAAAVIVDDAAAPPAAAPESSSPSPLPQPPAQQQQQHVVSTGMLYTELWPEYCNPSYRMPPVIEVKVALEQGDYVFPVAVEKADPSAKKYLGGFRNKVNGYLYHHAASQTPVVKKELKDTSTLRTRETQTSELRTLSTQSYREYGTQMERIDVHVDTRHDRVKDVRPYVTAAEVAKHKLLNTIKIQRFWRGYVARCLAHALRRRNHELDARDRRQRERAEEDAKQRAALEIARRANPQHAADFAILYNELDAWRHAELAKIKGSTLTADEKTKAMSDLLASETKALQSIQRLKHAAQRTAHAEKAHHTLELMAQPHRWQLANGTVAQVQTPATMRAKELLELYRALSAPVTPANLDGRLDILLHVKWTVQEFDDALTRDICDLVDREADLLNRGRTLKSMERLRVRLNNLVLQFLDDPTYNPRAADFHGP